MRIVRLEKNEIYHIFSNYIIITKNDGEWERVLPILARELDNEFGSGNDLKKYLNKNI